MLDEGFIQDTLRIQNTELPVKIGMLPQNKLRFYPENPRIYSIINADTEEPEQELIEKQLQSMEHVKELVQEIKSNGGLTDPVIILEGTWEVIEGNSRLAAYRHLFNKDPYSWSQIKCKVLPETVTQSQIFALLGQYHITGKKDWAPFEQAGFLYRRHINHGVDVSTLAKEIGLSDLEAKRHIETYEFMLKHKEGNVNRWSYYEEYIKSRKLKKLREDYPGFDDVVVRKIKTGEINKARDIRDRLPDLSNAKSKIVKRFIDGESNFEEAMDAVEDSGNADKMYLRINKFKHWIVSEATEEGLKGANPAVKGKIIYEFGKIAGQLKALSKILESQSKK